MTKSELLALFDSLKAAVADFAKPSVATPPTDAVNPVTERVYPGANPGITIEQGEESTVGHIHRWLDEAAALTATLVGKQPATN